MAGLARTHLAPARAEPARTHPKGRLPHQSADCEEGVPLARPVSLPLARWTGRCRDLQNVCPYTCHSTQEGWKRGVPTHGRGHTRVNSRRDRHPASTAAVPGHATASPEPTGEARSSRSRPSSCPSTSTASGSRPRSSPAASSRSTSRPRPAHHDGAQVCVLAVQRAHVCVGKGGN